MIINRLQGKLLSCILAFALCFGLCTVARASSLNVYCEPATAMPGDTVSFKIELANTSEYSMQSLSYSSDFTGFAFSGPNVIASGETGTYTGAVTMSDVMLDVPITFTVHWEYYDASGVSMGVDNLSASVTVPRGAAAADPTLPGAAGAGVSAERKVSTTKASKGEQVIITYIVNNNSASELSALNITDAELTGTPIVKDVSVAPGAVYTFDYNYTMGGETVVSAPVISYKADGAEASVTVPETSIGMVNTRLTVEVEQGSPTAEGVNFTLKLINNGNQKISKIKIKDEQGNSVNKDGFALSVGESKTLSYSVDNQNERNVVFYLTGSSAAGDDYTDNTKTYTVRKYVDPSLIGLDFSAEVLETLNAQGSIKLRFVVKNTGSVELQNLVLSEQQIGEIRRQETVPIGESVLEETVNVGTPRDMSFSVNVQDEAHNDYSYTANLTAAYIGVETASSQAPQSETNAIDDIESLGTQIGSKVSDALTVALVILAILCVLSAAALIALTVLEKKRKMEARQRRSEQRQQYRRQNYEAPDATRVNALRPEVPAYENYEYQQQTRITPRQDGQYRAPAAADPYTAQVEAERRYPSQNMQTPGEYQNQNGQWDIRQGTPQAPRDYSYPYRGTEPRREDQNAPDNGDTQRFYPPRTR